MSSFAPAPTPNTYRGGFRQVLTPLGSTRKRKDRDTPEASPRPPLPRPTRNEPKSEPKANLPQHSSRNIGSTTTNKKMVLAGYLAHEFLTRGTLLGQPLDGDNSGRVMAAPAVPLKKSAEEAVEESASKVTMAYADVSRLIMGENGTHIPGIVNPTQLARWMKQ